MGRFPDELVDPRHTAVVTSEVQEGVVGKASALPELAEEAQRTMLPTLARLAGSARATGVPVVHCTYNRREDGRGSNDNAPLFAAVRRSPVTMRPGSAETQVVEQIGVADEDLVLTRSHGLSPMTGTDLDPVLRNLGVSTVIVTGVSVNVAITNLVMDAVNRGYQVVLPRDAVCGVPADYADAVIDNTLRLLARVTTSEAIESAWS